MTDPLKGFRSAPVRQGAAAEARETDRRNHEAALKALRIDTPAAKTYRSDMATLERVLADMKPEERKSNISAALAIIEAKERRQRLLHKVNTLSNDEIAKLVGEE